MFRPCKFPEGLVVPQLGNCCVTTSSQEPRTREFTGCKGKICTSCPILLRVLVGNASAPFGLDASSSEQLGAAARALTDQGEVSVRLEKGRQNYDS